MTTHSRLCRPKPLCLWYRWLLKPCGEWRVCVVCLGLQFNSIYTTYSLFHLHVCHVCASFQCPYCGKYYNAGSQLSVACGYVLFATIVAFLVNTRHRTIFRWSAIRLVVLIVFVLVFFYWFMNCFYLWANCYVASYTMLSATLLTLWCWEPLG